MRLIDADALIAELEKDEERFDREAEDGKQNPQNCTAGYAEAMWSRANGVRDAIISIYDAPTIDAVEVVRGEWIDRSDGGRILNPWWESYECNKCGQYGTRIWKFCPKCGARMKG